MQNNEDDKLRELFSRLYTSSEEVESRMLKIKQDLNPENSIEVKESVSYYEVCFGPRYRKATALGVGISVLQQTTGTNIMNFYSN